MLQYIVQLLYFKKRRKKAVKRKNEPPESMKKLITTFGAIVTMIDLRYVETNHLAIKENLQKRFKAEMVWVVDELV